MNKCKTYIGYYVVPAVDFTKEIANVLPTNSRSALFIHTKPSCTIHLMYGAIDRYCHKLQDRILCIASRVVFSLYEANAIN